MAKTEGGSGFVITVDTREQKPYAFDGRESLRFTMQTGDYGILDYHPRVAIERKSWADFYGCLTKGRKRFEAELERLRVIDYPAIVVEAKHSELWRPFIRRARGGRTTRSRVPPVVAQKSIIAWSFRYRVPIWFCGNRERAEKWTLLLLDDAFRLLERERREAASGPKQ